MSIPTFIIKQTENRKEERYLSVINKIHDCIGLSGNKHNTIIVTNWVPRLQFKFNINSTPYITVPIKQIAPGFNKIDMGYLNVYGYNRAIQLSTILRQPILRILRYKNRHYKVTLSMPKAIQNF